MFHNYYFLKRLSRSLHKELSGLELLSCFSQNKNELVFGFARSKKEFWIRAHLDPNVSLISFPDTCHRANKNSMDLFPEIVNEKVFEVGIFELERSFQITFQNNHSLVFKMHGSRSNILLAFNDTIHSIFRKVHGKDLRLHPSGLNKQIEINSKRFKEAGYHPNSLIPALGKEVRQYWNEKFMGLKNEDKWEAFQHLVQHLETGPICLIENSTPKISLLPKKTEPCIDNPIEAANWLYKKATRLYYFEKERARLINQLNRQVRQSENYIFKTQEKLRAVNAQRHPEELANILMANLSIIKTGLEKATLHDLYENGRIEIKLNPKLSPQKNAERLYRKSKNRHQEIRKFHENIHEKEKKIKKLKQKIADISEAIHYKELKKFSKREDIGKKTDQSTGLYHEFEIDNWQILMGKNAKANDQLTLKVANKDDLWLHAKDVGGSHVVVRQKPGQNFPDHIIEEAASYAAFYSKRKTDTLCPVIYTLKKYVRKPKGSVPGSVIVEKEDVVLIEPKEPTQNRAKFSP